jgi:hypothetical protein
LCNTPLYRGGNSRFSRQEMKIRQNTGTVTNVSDKGGCSKTPAGFLEVHMRHLYYKKHIRHIFQCAVRCYHVIHCRGQAVTLRVIVRLNIRGNTAAFYRGDS